MIVCQKCGTENDNSAKFCKNPSCQSFLEWEGEAVQTTQQPAVRPGGAATGSTARPGAATPRGAAGDGNATQPGGTDPEELLAKPSPSGRAARNPGQPSAVKPAEAKQRPAETHRQSGARRDAGEGPPALKPGQSACPNCDWPVEPSWNFCHHCSTSLSLPKVRADGPKSERTSRWYSAGERPFRGGGGRGARVLVVLASVGALVGVGPGGLAIASRRQGQERRGRHDHLDHPAAGSGGTGGREGDRHRDAVRLARRRAGGGRQARHLLVPQRDRRLDAA